MAEPRKTPREWVSMHPHTFQSLLIVILAGGGSVWNSHNTTTTGEQLASKLAVIDYRLDAQKDTDGRQDDRLAQLESRGRPPN